MVEQPGACNYSYLPWCQCSDFCVSVNEDGLTSASTSKASPWAQVDRLHNGGTSTARPGNAHCSLDISSYYISKYYEHKHRQSVRNLCKIFYGGPASAALITCLAGILSLHTPSQQVGLNLRSNASRGFKEMRCDLVSFQMTDSIMTTRTAK